MNPHRVLSAEFLETSLTSRTGFAITDSDFLSAKPCQAEKGVMVTDICEALGSTSRVGAEVPSRECSGRSTGLGVTLTDPEP